MQKQLDMEAGKQIIDSVSRLAQLQALTTKDPNAVAEEAGLTEYVKNQLFEHAGHLLGCWFAIKNEYEPLCNAFASIANRAQGIQAQRRASEQASAAPAKEEDADESVLVAPPGTPIVLKPNFSGGKKRR